MTSEYTPNSPLLSPLSMAHPTHTAKEKGHTSHLEEQTSLLRQIVATLDRQNELLEELVTQTGASQRQRSNELGQWKQANPELARSCRVAAESLSRVQAEFLDTLAREATENADVMMDGEFMLTEFVDRFGPRLAHLNGVIQILSHLSASPESDSQ